MDYPHCAFHKTGSNSQRAEIIEGIRASGGNVAQDIRVAEAALSVLEKQIA